MTTAETNEQTAIAARLMQYEGEVTEDRRALYGTEVKVERAVALIEVGDRLFRFPVQFVYQDGTACWVAWGEWWMHPAMDGIPAVYPSVNGIGGGMGSPWGTQPWMHTYGIEAEPQQVDPQLLAAIACLYSDPRFAKAVEEATSYLAEIGAKDRWRNGRG